MQYITGTEIIVGETKRSVVKPGMSSTQIRTNRTTLAKEAEHFEPGVRYTLLRIYQSKDKVVYVFGGTQGDRVEVPFDSVRSAEAFIANTRGETITRTTLRERSD